MSWCDRRHSLISGFGHHPVRCPVFKLTTKTTQARDGCPPGNASPCPRVTSAAAADGVSPPAGSALGDHRALPAPTRGLIVSPRPRSHVPRHRSPVPSFHNRYRFLLRPSRLTLGVAAATLAGMAGVWAGVSTSATPPAGAAGSLDA